MKIVTDDVRPVTELRKSVPPNVAATAAKPASPVKKVETGRWYGAVSALRQGRRLPLLTALAPHGRVANSTAISASPLAEGVLHVGTDDGRIQVSDDRGAAWRLAALPGIPSSSLTRDDVASDASRNHLPFIGICSLLLDDL